MAGKYRRRDRWQPMLHRTWRHRGGIWEGDGGCWKSILSWTYLWIKSKLAKKATATQRRGLVMFGFRTQRYLRRLVILDAPNTFNLLRNGVGRVKSLVWPMLCREGSRFRHDRSKCHGSSIYNLVRDESPNIFLLCIAQRRMDFDR